MSEELTDASSLIAPLRRLYEQAEQDVEEAVKAKALAEDRKRRYRGALRALDPEFTEAEKPKRKPKGRASASTATVAVVFEAIRDGAETMAEIVSMTDLSDATVRKAIDDLRGREMIRKRRSGDRPGRPMIYKVLPMGDARGLPVESLSPEAA